MIKKRQYTIWQYALENIYQKENKLYLELHMEDSIRASETLMFYILHEKIKKTYAGDSIAKFDNEGNRIPNNILPIISVETGRSKTDEESKVLSKLLQDGFYTNTEPESHFVFIDNVLSGSQNKECRQMFVLEKYLKQLKEHVSLGKEPTKCTVSKNLTRNALTTTDIYLVPVDMTKLGICIIPDCEVPVIEDVNMVKTYKRTTDEEKLYKELMEKIDANNQYYDMVKEAKELVNDKECKVETESYKSRDKEKYRTVNQWKEEEKKVIVEELIKPAARIYNDKKGKYTPLYTKEQTAEFSEDDLRDIPVTEWSTGLQLAQDNNHTCMENVFDGMGLVSKELGEVIEKVIDPGYHITGYQLRLPSIKGFFPVVDFKGYFKKHKIEVITDMWGQPHKINEIDILTTESTFKAKLNVTGLKEDGSEKKEWLFESIKEYKELLIQYGYDVIGISNFAKPLEEEYRRATYQLWLALNMGKLDIIALSNIQGDIIHRVLSIYEKDEINWEDIKYIEAFLNLIQKENADSNLAKDCSDAMKAIQINKKMVFDRKVIQSIRMVLNRKIDDMCMGRFYVKGRYLYVTQDILAFLDYAGAENKNEYTYTGFLKDKECYCGKSILGETVLARNPIMSYSEIAKVKFVDYIGEDSEFIIDLNNIIQLPLGTEPDRLGGCDRDGDELFVLSCEYNLKDTKVEYLQNYNYIVKNEKSEFFEKNMLEVINGKMQNHWESKFSGQDSIRLLDYVVSSIVQVNDDDKATAPSKDWNKDNVIDFILTSEDKTGSITDINTIIENVANHEGDLQAYALPIAIMKDLQGKMIDASKSGLFDQVVIPEVIKLKYRQKPRFMYFKDGKEYGKDYSVMSSLDFISEKMKKYKEYVNKIMTERVNRKIKSQNFENIYNLLMNPDLDGTAVQDVIDKLQSIYKDFIKQNQKLAKERSEINPYSSDDKYKQQRKLVDEKFKELYDNVKEQAEKICECQSLLATASVRMTYINTKSNGQNDNYSFCWVLAADGILQNIKMHEDKDKITITKVVDNRDGCFEWLGEYFRVNKFEGEYPISYVNEAAMHIPEEILKKCDGALGNILNLTITIMGVERGKAEEVAKNIKGKSYPLFINEKGWLGITENMSIKERETLDAGIDLKKYVGHEIIIKEIVNAKAAQTVIKAIVDVVG
jgi:hypothetical protein